MTQDPPAPRPWCLPHGLRARTLHGLRPGSEMRKPGRFLLEAARSVFPLAPFADAERKKRPRVLIHASFIPWPTGVLRPRSANRPATIAAQLCGGLRLTVHLRLLNLKRKKKRKPRNPQTPTPSQDEQCSNAEASSISDASSVQVQCQNPSKS